MLLLLFCHLSLFLCICTNLFSYRLAFCTLYYYFILIEYFSKTNISVYNSVLFIYFVLLFIYILVHTCIIMYICLYFVVLILCNIRLLFTLFFVYLHVDLKVTIVSMYNVYLCYIHCVCVMIYPVKPEC